MPLLDFGLVSDPSAIPDSPDSRMDGVVEINEENDHVQELGRQRLWRQTFYASSGRRLWLPPAAAAVIRGVLGLRQVPAAAADYHGDCRRVRLPDERWTLGA